MYFIKTWSKRFVLSLQFMTKIPIKKNIDIWDDDMAGTVVFFPLIGFIIGLLMFISAALLRTSVVSGVYIAGVTIAIGAIITGGLHIDGLGDTCDGVFSYTSKERALEIMRDSRSGSFAVIGIVLALITKVGALSNLVFEDYYITLFAACTLPPIFGRMGIAYMCAVGKPARDDGSGRKFLLDVTFKHFLAASIIAIVLSLIIIGPVSILIYAVTVGVAALVTLILSKRLGGVTGDCMGFVNEICEIAVFGILIFRFIYYIL